MSLHNYQRLASRLESLKDELNRKKGILSSSKSRLKKEFGCNSVEEARAKSKELELKIKKQTEKLNSVSTELEKLLNENS